MDQLTAALETSGRVILNFFRILVDLESYIELWANEYHVLIYIIVFLIIYSETGLVVAAFLPGDSLLFLLGTLSGIGLLNIYILIPLIIIAALMGDTTNFFVGKFVRGKINKDTRWIKLEHVEKTRNFYERHGGKTLIIARFLPIFRTYAPFVAGISMMNYRRFIIFNVVGAVLWSVTIIPAGYFLGKIDFISKLIGPVMIAIVIISIFAFGYTIYSNYAEKKHLSEN